MLLIRPIRLSPEENAASKNTENHNDIMHGLSMIYEKLIDKKKRLDGFRPFPDVLVRNLDGWFRVKLTYTSNAIEGNTLSRRETALVVEKGLTVGRKSLTEHLKPTNHVPFASP